MISAGEIFLSGLRGAKIFSNASQSLVMFCRKEKSQGLRGGGERERSTFGAQKIAMSFRLAEKSQHLVHSIPELQTNTASLWMSSGLDGTQHGNSKMLFGNATPYPK